MPFVSAGARSDSDKNNVGLCTTALGAFVQQLSGTFFKVRQAGILDYSVRWTALHSVRLPQTYDSSFELWAPCVNKDAQHFQAAAAGWKSFCKSIHNAAKGKRRTLHTFEGHCTSKNGASPELKLIKAPVLETSMWATAGKTLHSLQPSMSHKPWTCDAVKLDCK